MHINDLSYDVLHRILAILDSINSLAYVEEQVVSLACVCRSWKLLMLPYLYSTVYLHYDGETPSSNARRIVKGGHESIPRTLEVVIADISIDRVNLAEKLIETEFRRVVWPQVSKLVIKNNCIGAKACKAAKYNQAGSIAGVLRLLNGHVPNIKEIEYDHTDRYDRVYDNCQPHSYSLFSKLVSNYSHQLYSLAFWPNIEHMPRKLVLPQQLTHLDINMSFKEKQRLSQIYAPSLRRLIIRNAAADITWNWFDSSDEKDVWFMDLRELSIEFGYDSHRASHYTGNLAEVIRHKCKSDYRAFAKYAHFPVLERLGIAHYPYHDDSFYRLFESCPLRKIDVKSPAIIKGFIPPHMIASAEDIRLDLYPSNKEHKRTADSTNPKKHRKASYQNAVSTLLSSPSPVRKAYISAFTTQTLSLPDMLAWDSVRSLELEFLIDLQSAFTVLAQMRMLQDLRVYMSMDNLKWLSKGDSRAYEHAIRKQEYRLNKRMEHLSIFFTSTNISSKRSLEHLFTALFQLVPSLLKLETNDEIVNIAREILSPPNHSLRHVSRQLEVVPWTGKWSVLASIGEAS